MKKKIIGVAVTVVICIGLVVGGAFISKNNNAEDNEIPSETSVTEPSVVTSAAEFTQNSNIVFDTTDREKLPAPKETKTETNASGNAVTANDKIYIDEQNNDETVTGGNFSWR